MSLVREFHEKFGHPIANYPSEPDFPVSALRVRLLIEEVLEFAEASGITVDFISRDGKDFMLHRNDPAVNLVEAADALADIRYVTDGANLVWGFPQEAILEEVHRSNMSKLGPDGKPIYREDGKVMKGPGYFKPDIKGILDRELFLKGKLNGD